MLSEEETPLRRFIIDCIAGREGNDGYNNMSYFHRIFEERFGMSPKKYRDKNF